MAKKRTKKEFKELRTEHDFHFNEAYIREDLLPAQKIISITRFHNAHDIVLELSDSDELNFQNLIVRTNVQLLEYSAAKNLMRIRISFVNKMEVYISDCV